MSETVKFRETLWFKLGDLPPPEDLDVRDFLEAPVTAADTAAFGVHTGTTRALMKIDVSSAPVPDLDLGVLARELQTSRRRWWIAAGLTAVAVITVLAVVALLGA